MTWTKTVETGSNLKSGGSGTYKSIAELREESRIIGLGPKNLGGRQCHS